MNMQGEEVTINLPHHIQHELCTSRAPYRQGRKLTSVKVYTVNNESPHLLIFKVPAIDLLDELKVLCARFGQLAAFYKLVVQNEEEFTDTYHAHYVQIKQARYAKRQMDNRQFYGGVLHVCYAPEMETLEETRSKLTNRRKEIAYYSGRKINQAPFMKTIFIPKTPFKRGIVNKNDPINYSKRAKIEEPKQEPYMYPSQKVLELPGCSYQNHMVNYGNTKLIPSSVMIKSTLSVQKPVPKIIFHKKELKDSKP